MSAIQLIAQYMTTPVHAGNAGGLILADFSVFTLTKNSLYYYVA